MNYFPKSAPTTLLGWLEATLSWLWINVVWGIIVILIGLFSPLIGGGYIQVTNDFVAAITVLSITLCGTQLEFPPSLSVRKDIYRRWLTRVSYFVLLFGAILAFINSNDNPIINRNNLNPETTYIASLILFAISLSISISAFFIRSLAQEDYLQKIISESRRNEGYENIVNSDKEAMIAEARQAEAVGDLKL